MLPIHNLHYISVVHLGYFQFFFANINICLIFLIFPRKDSYKGNESKSIIFFGSSCILFTFLPETLYQFILPPAVYRNILYNRTLATMTIHF